MFGSIRASGFLVLLLIDVFGFGEWLFSGRMGMCLGASGVSGGALPTLV